MKFRFYLRIWLYSIILNVLLFTLTSLGETLLFTHQFPSGIVLKFLEEDILFVGLFSLPFSIPGLLSLLVSVGLSAYFMQAWQRLFFIMLFCLTGTLAGYFLLWAILNINLFHEAPLCLPVSLAAVVISLLINRKRFYRTFGPEAPYQLPAGNNSTAPVASTEQ